MSISSEITRIQNKRDLSFQEVQNKGVTVPAGSTIDDLPGLIALIEAGGSSSEGEVLLGSGTFTLAADTTNIMSIPISITGVPTTAFVEAATFSTAGNATAAWILFAQNHQEVHSLFMNPMVIARISVTNGSYTGSKYIIDGSVSLTTNVIQVRQYSGSIPIRANTYNWYVWGLES